MKNPMDRFIQGRKKEGSPPGELTYQGESRDRDVQIEVIDYSEDGFERRTVEEVEDAFEFRERDSVTWIDVDGVHDTEIVLKLGEHYGVHPLVREDIVNTDSRPKLDVFDDQFFLQFKTMEYGEGLEPDQVSIIVLDNTVISFQESRTDQFDPVRERIEKGRGKIRSREKDYLAYALLDAAVDGYLAVLDEISERLEPLEPGIVENPEKHQLEALNRLKTDIVLLRKNCKPLLGVVTQLESGEVEMIREENLIYFSDVKDHLDQVLETAEAFRDVVSGNMDLYYSSVSHRMNEVMKVLTVVATVFIPLTFIAGVYGMNFENMPELGWSYGYLAVWTVMIGVTAAELLYFRKRGWM